VAQLSRVNNAVSAFNPSVHSADDVNDVAESGHGEELGRERALNLRLPGGPHAPAAARAAIETLPDGSLDPDVRHTTRLLASEIVTNSVRHAGAGDDGLVGFELTLSPAAVRVEVADHGPGFRPAPDLPDADETGGRGLFLVDQLADRWGTSHGGTHVWFELDRPAG